MRPDDLATGPKPGALGPRASSVTLQGEEDGFVVRPGWSAEATPDGDTRLVASVPHTEVAAVLEALIGKLVPPVSVLYRRKVDRKNPGPASAPAEDFVALSLPPGRVLAALQDAPTLVASDARAELWFRGKMQEQVVLDGDGLLYCYPDDPTFRDALEAAGVPPEDVETLAQRDYVKHWFRAEADAEEERLLARLGFTKMPTRRD